VTIPRLLMLVGKVPKPEPGAAPAPGASKGVISELAPWAAKRTGIAGAPTKDSVVNNISVRIFMKHLPLIANVYGRQ
jgi:hypothetical protein